MKTAAKASPMLRAPQAGAEGVVRAGASAEAVVVRGSSSSLLSSSVSSVGRALRGVASLVVVVLPLVVLLGVDLLGLITTGCGPPS